MQDSDLAHILRQHTEGATIDVANDTVAVTRTLLSQCADTIDCFTADSGHDAKVIAALREALEPFAEVARWANRNRHDLAKDFDMILRGPGPTIAGHLQVQSRDFIAALATIEQTAGESK